MLEILGSPIKIAKRYCLVRKNMHCQRFIDGWHIMLKMKSVEGGNSLSISVGEKSKHETDSSRSYINSFFLN